MNSRIAVAIPLLIAVGLGLPAAGLTVVAPDGTQPLIIGRTVQILWTRSTDVADSAKVRVMLYQGATKIGDIATNVPVTQLMLSWKAGQYGTSLAAAGNDYRVRVRIAGSSTMDDSPPFTLRDSLVGSLHGPDVKPVPMKPTITITSHYNKHMKVGDPDVLTWTKIGDMAPNVRITMRNWDDSTWPEEVLAESVPNNGHFYWTFPQPKIGLMASYRIYIWTVDRQVYAYSSDLIYYTPE